MPTDRPSFSIVMPTRNRARLFRSALQSALAQTHDDFEVVISNNQSSDNTDEVARSFDDPRVRYFETDQTLPMSRNWEFALSKARGEYVTYLCDDDAIVPSLLERVAALLDESDRDVIYWNSAAYYHDSWIEARKRNHLVVSPLVHDVEVESSRAALRELFNLRHFHRNYPKMLNTCLSRRLIDKVITRNGQFFQVSCPDYSTITTVTALTEEMTYLHPPLMLAGVANESIGATCRRQMSSDASQQFWGEHSAEHALRWEAPLKQGSVTNAVADTILRTKRTLGDATREVELNWPAYFVLCRSDIEDERRHGGDVTELMQAWEKVLQRQSALVQSETHELWKTHLANRRASWRSRAKEVLFPWIPQRLLSCVSERQNINGRTAGFRDIAGAAVSLDQQLPPVESLVTQPTNNGFGLRAGNALDKRYREAREERSAV
ncbi:MAG: glycosyltransferase family A protein [Planctomycetaceae bacterium]